MCPFLTFALACHPETPYAAAEGPTGAGAVASPGVILFLGTSLTAGFDLPPAEAYPARIQEKLDASGLPYKAVNAGVSGDTSAGGLRRLDWLLRQPVLVMVLELGANDMLRGQSVEAMSENLQSIIDRLSDEHPSASVVVAGMRAAPNLGRSYTEAFDASFLALATHNDAVLVPFLLGGVAGEPGLNLPDGIHPNAEGHRIVADTIWAVQQPLLVGTTAGPEDAMCSSKRNPPHHPCYDAYSGRSISRISWNSGRSGS